MKRTISSQNWSKNKINKYSKFRDDIENKLSLLNNKSVSDFKTLAKYI